jgi:guanylate kinase
VIAGGNSEQREVETGASGTAMTEIVSGLNEGDNVVYEVELAGMPGGQNGAPGGMGSPPPGAPTEQ